MSTMHGDGSAATKELQKCIAAVDAAPGVSAEVRSRVRTRVDEVLAQLGRSAGRDLDALVAASHTLGTKGCGLGPASAATAASTLVPGASEGWAEAVGVLAKERSDEERQCEFFRSVDQLGRDIRDCCCAVETVQNTTDSGVSLVLAVPRKMVQAATMTRMQALIPDSVELLLTGLGCALQMVRDGNRTIEECLTRLTTQIGQVAEARPAEPADYRTPEPAKSAQCDPPAGTAPAAQPAPAPAPPAPPASPVSSSAPEQPGVTAPETKPAAATVADAPSPAPAATPAPAPASVATTPAQVVPAQPLPQTAPPAQTEPFSRLCRCVPADCSPVPQPSTTPQQSFQPPTLQEAPATPVNPVTPAAQPTLPASTAVVDAPVQPSAQASERVTVEFDFDIDGTVNVSLNDIPCETAAAFTPPAPEHDQVNRMLGTFAEMGAAAVLGGLECFSTALQEAVECPGVDCGAHAPEPAHPPEPAPATVPAPPPVAEPVAAPEEPAPAPAPEPTPDNGVIPPPPELAQVEEPAPPPKKQLPVDPPTVAQAAPDSSAPAAEQPAIPDTNPSTDNPTPPEQAPWAVKKTGDW
ncbi:hypothetical protein [Corynebacterium glaucum]|uniref:hypothetical protein n=1 Tax=Corynebacterium glaucum TaxID=187491 RepID=UPI0025B2DE17|nr:hypothetical protein [Corynebacterium glaucum]WJZ06954.1 hypothetical protein CGLAUT_02240 [Corynebacterium glaucum]